MKSAEDERGPIPEHDTETIRENLGRVLRYAPPIMRRFRTMPNPDRNSMEVKRARHLDR